ncbi:ExbD/TolR family protein [Oceanicoccus sagamiensis]|uniref:Biopolymer transporter ExbD n=1 Tax=Oceanicoccus sagamiensis TaxID=716816 RepID=A0A1X9NCT5_9GAMM|nr:biopolymer transporter ExbD [Oceanicoccus sagamiensis]ARN75840.1 biopolymer transporter ExbD [Oceanicoccus sagamiensis]
MQFKRQSKAAVSVDLTPLIDVVFLLLIFFMVSTTFTKETHLSLDLPEASGEEKTDLPQQIEVLIDANGQYVINGRSLVSTSIETVIAALETVQAGDVKVPLVITADAATPHQAVITAMDAAGQLGFVQLSLTTKKPASD